MRFNFSPPSMNQLAAMFGGGNRPAQPPTADTVDGPAPPPPPPQGGTAATGAGGAAGFGSMPMAPDIMAQMRGFFPGLSVLPSSPSNGPAPPLPSSPPATGATNGLPTSPSSNASLPPDVDGAQPNPQATANPFLQSLIDSVLSQIIIPSDPNAPPPDPNAPPSEGHPIFVTLHFGGPPPQEDKEPDPERAKELLSALEKPERGLVLRLDRGLRLEEEEAGVEAGERTGARCSVCLDSLLDADDEEESEKGKEKEERDDVAMAEEKEGQEVLSLPCSHAFHRGCLGPWLEMHTNCPTCRFDLDPLSTTLRPNRTATTLPSRTSTPNPANPTPNNGSSSASSTSTSNPNRPHPYSRPPTRPSTPQPPAPTPTSTSTSTPVDSRPYTPPPARLTLLSRVLSLESSHHLRCSLPLCTHAPSSSHPQGYPTKTKMFSLVRAEGELAPEAFGAERKRWVLNGCEHVFHPSCLRIEEGVWMGGAREGEWDKEGRKKVWCPVRNCKGEGWVAREDWDGVDEEDGEEEMEVESGLNGNEKKIDVALMDLDQPAPTSAATTATAASSLETDVEFDLD
ncbi:hypothetical protein BDY24DRAFT_394863 [Mrakia frigida]|uniref:RING-H2 finger protein n=1 Tax=Mrakia frigida TaxID=29902 RepID=UPI003FCC1A4B